MPTEPAPLANPALEKIMPKGQKKPKVTNKPKLTIKEKKNTKANAGK
mgnify:CR=1 FL=1